MTARRALQAEEIARAIEGMATAIAKAEPRGDRLALIGIRRGGVPLAARLGALLQGIYGAPIPRGTLDIGLYRDDVARVHPVVGPTEIAFPIQERPLVLVVPGR